MTLPALCPAAPSCKRHLTCLLSALLTSQHCSGPSVCRPLAKHHTLIAFSFHLRLLRFLAYTLSHSCSYHDWSQKKGRKELPTYLHLAHRDLPFGSAKARKPDRIQGKHMLPLQLPATGTATETTVLTLWHRKLSQHLLIALMTSLDFYG